MSVAQAVEFYGPVKEVLRTKLGDMVGAISDFEAAVSIRPKLKASLAPAMSDAYYRRARFLVERKN